MDRTVSVADPLSRVDVGVVDISISSPPPPSLQIVSGFLRVNVPLATLL